MKLSFKKTFLISVVIFAVFFFVLLYRISSNRITENERQKVLSANSGGANLLPQTSVSHIEYKGKHFRFFYPKNARITRADPLPEYSLEQVIVDSIYPRLSVAAEVISRKNYKSLDDIPSVQFRRLNSDLYTEDTVVIDGQKGYIFIKNTEGAEKTVFIQTEQYIYSFSITAGSASSAYNNLSTKILNSIAILE